MTGNRFVSLLIALFSAGPLVAERPYVNDQQAPGGVEDLKVIESLNIAALPAAMSATVCIDLGEGSGSGVVVSEDGLILTAAHVTAGVGRELTVILQDGRKVKAESLGLDSETDAAMARIIEPGSYPHVEVEKGGGTRLGDWVFALGHSNGFDELRGVNLRRARIVRVSDSTFQSDCYLIGGDSGGPLFNLDGRLIGIHSRVGGTLQENMHVPMRVFLDHWDAMLAEKFLGDGPFAERPEKGKAFLGLSTEEHTGDGLRVKKIGRESPAERAGIEAGDILLSMDGESLETRDQFKELMAEKAPDERVAFEMLRNEKVETLTLRLGNREN